MNNQSSSSENLNPYSGNKSPEKNLGVFASLIIFLTLFITILGTSLVVKIQPARGQVYMGSWDKNPITGQAAGPGQEWRELVGTGADVAEQSGPVYVLVSKGSANSLAGAAVSKAGEWLSDKIWEIVCGVLYIIARFLNFLVYLVAQALDVVLKAVLYVNLVNNPMIIMGWTAIRDICNMFFLIILLFISFCTILQIDKYHIKKTLLTLIIMALLINFSKPIAIFIFDGSQLLMNYFLKMMVSGGQSFSGSIAGVSKIAEIVFNNVSTSKATGSDLAVQYLFAILFLFMFAVALIILTVYLFIRIVAVMILIIVSPVAFFANILPDFSGMSSTWWKSMIKYSYVGPAIAFFLLLSTKMATALPNIQPAARDIPPTIQKTVTDVIHYLVVLIFLYAAIIISEKFGVQFAGSVTKNANRFMGWAGRGTYKVPQWAARRSGVTGAVQQKIESIPFARRWLTKAGRDEAQQDREAAIAEYPLGVEGARDKVRLTRMAEINKKWKDQGITEDPDALRVLSHTGNPLERATAARELAKGKHITNADEYKGLYNDIGQISPRLQTIFAADTRKNMPHLHFRNEVNRGVAVPDAFNTTFRGQSFEDIMKNTPVDTLTPIHKDYDADFDNLVVAHWGSLKPNVQQGMLTKMPAPMVNLLRSRGLIP